MKYSNVIFPTILFVIVRRSFCVLCTWMNSNKIQYFDGHDPKLIFFFVGIDKKSALNYIWWHIHRPYHIWYGLNCRGWSAGGNIICGNVTLFYFHCCYCRIFLFERIHWPSTYAIVYRTLSVESRPLVDVYGHYNVCTSLTKRFGLNLLAGEWFQLLITWYYLDYYFHWKMYSFNFHTIINCSEGVRRGLHSEPMPLNGVCTCNSLLVSTWSRTISHIWSYSIYGRFSCQFPIVDYEFGVFTLPA